MPITYKSADENWITGEDPIGGGGVNKWTTDERTSPHQQAKLLFALSNGQVEGLLHADGLKDIYLNDVPIQNPDGSFNYNGVSVAMTAGTLTQEPIPGFADVEALTSSGNLISHASPQSFSVSNAGPTAARVNLSIPAIYQTSTTDGKMSSDSVTLKFEVSNNGGAFVDVTATVDPVSLGVITAQSTGIITRSYRIPLTSFGSGSWVVRVSRVTVDNNTAYRDNRVYLQSWAAITEQQLRYPRTALLAFACDARRFPSMPKVSVKIRGIKVQVPANYTPAMRDPDTGVWTAAVYATTGTGTSGGSWDGTFKTSWTSNPAWVLYDLITNPLYGCRLPNGVNKWTLYAMAQICDGMVSDGLGGQEPRFVFNGYLQSADEAYSLLGQVAACARAQTFYAGGQVVPIQDVDRSPVSLFTPANVVEGRFTYQGTSRRARHTVCNVRWNDPAQGYREVPEMVIADDTYVTRYGLQPQTLRALGCTSLGQARRFGRWSILSEMEEPETVAFSSGLEGIVARPGDIVLVQDPARARVRLAGRLKAATTSTVTLDSPVTLQAGQTYTLWAQLPDGSVVGKTVTTAAGTTSSLTISGTFYTPPQAQAVWMLSSTNLPASRWSVLSVKENQDGKYDIVALANYQPKYAAADSTDTLVERISDPLLCKVPTGLSVAHTVDRSHLDRLVYVLAATWTAPSTAPVVYQAQARLAGGSWRDMDASGCSASLQDVEVGGWEVRVRGVYRWGLSDWTTPVAHTIANAGGSPAETALAGLAAVADDATLDKGEKSRIITEYNTAVADYALLVAKAQATGTSYAAYAEAFTALQTYLLGLSPAYSDVTQDTPINATDWQTTWNNYYAASTDLLLKLAGAPPSAVDLAATTNWSLTTNASAPVIDGVTSAAAQTVILAGQSTPSQNGLYQIAYTPAVGGGYVYPSTGAYTYTGQAGTYTNGANAYDGTGTTPNTGTYATLTGGATIAGTHTVIYSGWSGTGLTGNLEIKITPQCLAQEDGYSSTVTVYFSTDGGTTWSTGPTYGVADNGTMQTATLAVTGATGSQMRIKVVTSTIIPRYWDTGTNKWVDLVAAVGSAQVNSAHFNQAATGSANYSFTKLASIPDGTLWRVRTGNVYGGKVYLAAVDGSNVITLTQQAYDTGSYDVNCSIVGKPAAGAEVLRYPAPRPFSIQAQGHLGSAGTANTTNPKDFTVAKNGSTIGTLRFGASGAFSIVSFTATSFATGDILTITAPASQDATLANIGLTLRGNI